jgi:Flp pilus assembly protein TadG
MYSRISSLLRPLCQTATAFRRNRRGNIAVTFGFALLPCIGVIGAGIDYSRMIAAKSLAQSALDGAVLQAVKAIASETNAELKSGIESWVTGSLSDDTFVFGTPTIDRTEKTITDTMTVSISTVFMDIFGVNTLSSTLTSTATGSNKSYMEVYFLLDNSASMGLAATTAGQTTMKTYASCVFACHTQQGSTTYTYNKTKYTTTYALAKALGVTLRTDVMNTAAEAVLDLIDELDSDHERIKVGVYYFNTAITAAQAPSYSTTAGRSALTGSYSALGVDGSYFDVVMPAMATIVGSSGDGTRASTPKKLVLLVTDGAQSKMSWLTTTAGQQKITPLNPTWCQTLKNNDVTVGVLYTEYLAAASDSHYTATLGKTMTSSVWTSTWGGTLHTGVSGSTIRRDYISYALSDCATSSDYFISASDTSEITSGLTTLFDTWTTNIRLAE